jgi:Ca-activated chloride channel family protein
MRAFLSGFAILCLVPSQLAACTVALLLMMDVSQSVDAGEFKLQTIGLARALEDQEIRETLLRGNAALAVMQWSGQGAQSLSIPWRQIYSRSDLDQLVAEVLTMRRAFLMSNTALGDAVRAGLDRMAEAPVCARRVIDVSGDGPDNTGSDPRAARHAAERAGITINGLAIESLGLSITNYFRSSVITRGGFVITARGYRDYARAIREKIARETAQNMF